MGSLNNGESTTFEITFTPIIPGSKTAAISIVNNDLNENPFVLNLTGIAEHEPIITVSNLTDFGEELVGSTSSEKTYTVSGSNLVEAIKITANTGFEISLTSGNGFANALTLNPTNGVVNTTSIYVRFSPPSISDYDGIISHASINAATKQIAIKGRSSKTTETTPGKAIKFNGSTDYLSIANDPIMEFGAGTDFTVALWMKTTNWQNDASLASNKDWDSGSRDSWNIALGTDEKGIDVNVGDGSNRADLQAGDINDGEWHHIAATFDRDGSVSLYIDGILEQSTSMAHVGDINSGLPLTFGRDSENEYFFDGWIDEAKIWNAALTVQQIREAMHITANLSTPNLIAYYQFNEPGHIGVYNLRGSVNGSLIGGERPESTIPVGGGFANTQTETTGTVDFGNADASIAFTSQNSAEIVVSKINLAPNTLPTGLTRVFNSQYWTIHRFGTGSFAGNITFKVDEDLTSTDTTAPDDIVLYGRNFNSDGSWALIDVATAVNATTNQAIFNNISNFDQFIIGSTSDGAAAVDCIPDVLYENRHDFPDVTSSTTYIKAGNLNGNGDAIIRSGQTKMFRAKEFILLQAGFHAEAGSEFTAKIEDCSAGLVDDLPQEKVATLKFAPKLEEGKLNTVLDINIYPNPFENQFFIDYRIGKDAKVKIQLYDILGQKVKDIIKKQRKTAGIHQAKFTNRNLMEGTYILMIQVDGQISQQKVVMSGKG